MGKYKMKEQEIDEVITIINTKGHEHAAQIVTQKYGMNYQAFKNRVYREGKYTYNRTLKKYELVENQGVEFLSLEELTLQRKVSLSGTSLSTKSLNGLEALLQDLIKERLLEYNTFIQFDRYTIQVSINLSYLKEQGYDVKTL